MINFSNGSHSSATVHHFVAAIRRQHEDVRLSGYGRVSLQQFSYTASIH